MLLAYIDPGTGFTITTAGGLLLAVFSGFLGIILIFLKRIIKFFKRHYRPVLIGLVIIAGIAAGIYFMQKKDSPYQGRIIILGFDGLSPRIIEPLMAEGQLKNFERLKAAGGYRHLATTNPPQSPVAWTGFSTGKNPGKSGIFDFIARDPATYKISLCLSKIENNRAVPVVKTERFWQHASERGVPSVIVACPVTFPPDKIKGRMLAGMGVPDILGTEGTFSFYTTEPETEQETTGGKVFYLNPSRMMISDLIGPKTAGIKGRAENVKVALKIERVQGGEVELEYQKNKVRLKPGQWSEWQTITFDLGWFKKIKGIFKFFLVESEPELKLYVTPINMDPRQPLFPISHPASYSRQWVERIGLYRTQGMPFDTWALNEKRIDEKIFMDIAHEIFAEKQAMLAGEMERFENGILYVYFESPDIIQHMFWRYRDPQHPLYEPDAPPVWRDMITNWYREMDRVLGQALDQLKPDDILIVLSDHGFDTFRRAVHLNTWLRDNGYLELRDEAALSGGPLLTSIDWSRTRAYALGFNSLYINQRGREAQGIVAPGAETEQLKQEIAAKLRQWTDPKFNQPIIHQVYPRQEVYWGPHQDETPDLIVGYNIGYRASWQTGIGAVPRDQIEDNLKKWSGSHLFDPHVVPGILFANRQILKEQPSIMDIAPTVLKIIGYSEEELKALEFDGSPLW